MTTLPLSPKIKNNKPRAGRGYHKLERETRLELATSNLGKVVAQIA
jgi:hypothetical protein